MNSHRLLQDLLQKKRTYESLLALNAAGRHKSSEVETMLKSQLYQVMSAINNLQAEQKSPA